MHALRLVFPAVIALLTLMISQTSPALAKHHEGFLRTRVFPYVAGVFVNDKYYGTAGMFSHRRAAIRLAPGKYRVSLVDPRYKTMVANVTIKSGEVTTIREWMKAGPPPPPPPYGELKVEDFGNAAVYLDGRYSGNADEFNGPGQFMLLKPGEYKVKVVPASGGPAHEEKIKIAVEKTTVVRKP